MQDKSEKNLENRLSPRPRYPQPYHIKIDLYNEALNSHLILKEHCRKKYLARRENKSKILEKYEE